MRAKFGGISDRGKVREQNEDSFVIDSNLGLAAVADGMGGHNAGEVASRMAVDLLHQKLAALPQEKRSTLPSLVEVVAQSSQEIFICGQSDLDKRNMGCTLVALLIHKNRGFIASVGDSRAYLCRAKDVRPITQDHTFVQELINVGRLSPEEARVHPFRNVLSRAVGVLPEVEVDSFEVELLEGDRVLLCSDGLYGYLPAEKLKETLLKREQSPATTAQTLVDLANEHGGGDNITAIVVDLLSETAALAPEAAPLPAKARKALRDGREKRKESRREEKSALGETFAITLGEASKSEKRGERKEKREEKSEEKSEEKGEEKGEERAPKEKIEEVEGEKRGERKERGKGEE